MIQHILFPVDFSLQSEASNLVVRHWAELFGARVTMLHVFEGMGVLAIENLPVAAEMNIVKDLAKKQLDGFLLREFEGLQVERVQVSGDAGAAITEYAATHGVDLIMMPTMGYTRFRQMLLGSVTASVLHDSEVPVWTSAHSPEGIDTRMPQRIVCAVDCGPETAKVIGKAQELAEKFGASLRVVHSKPQVAAGFESGIAEGAHHFALRVAKEDYAAVTSGLSVVPELEILEDASLVEGVQRVVKETGSELLVIGRGRIQGFMGRLRSNAHDLIRMSGCGVVSI